MDEELVDIDGVLHSAKVLTNHGAPERAAVEAVALTLPAPTEHDVLATQRVAMQGPPAEAVGLDPYPKAARPRPIDLELGTRIPVGKGSS